MTTDPTALQERIYRTWCPPEWDEPTDDLNEQTIRNIHREMCWEQAAAVLPIITTEVRAAKAEALRDAARYFAGGLHCADMRTTPEETVRYLNRRATEYETGEQT